MEKENKSVETTSTIVAEVKKELSPDEVYGARVKKMTDRQLLAELARIASAKRSNKLIVTAFAVVLRSQMEGYINGRRVYVG